MLPNPAALPLGWWLVRAAQRAEGQWDVLLWGAVTEEQHCDNCREISGEGKCSIAARFRSSLNTDWV